MELAFELSSEPMHAVMNIPAAQGAFSFPQPLTEKYRPAKIADFVGLDKVRRVMSKLAAEPYRSAWFFLGNSGTGKTTMALSLANEMPAQLHHIASKECDLDTVKKIAQECHYMPRMFDTWRPCRMHLVIVDEADQMSYPAQLAFLSLLDETAFPPNTVFIFTGNRVDNLESRFMSRVRLLEFSSYGIASSVSELLQRVWNSETQGKAGLGPNFQRIVKESANNVRAALMTLETEIMCA
jgi:replication-associated recombination protein RarA